MNCESIPFCIPSSYRKDEKSSRPTRIYRFILSCRQYCTWKNLSYFLLFIAILIAMVSYYAYLDALYIIDGLYDMRGPRELTTPEKLSLKVIANDNPADLQRFVLHYAVCPLVHQIIILWSDFERSPPAGDPFKYSTSHAKVSFQTLSDPNAIFESVYDANMFHTDSIGLFDLDLFIACDDLQFMYSVWQSSQVAPIGIFPRLIESSREKSFHGNHQLLPGADVMWRGQYNLLLSSMILVHKQQLLALSRSKELKSILSTRPHCSAYVPSLWISSQNPSISPIWADVSLRIEKTANSVSFPVLQSSDSNNSNKKKRSVALPIRQTLTSEESNQCIQSLMKALNVDSLQPSFGKATQAKNHLWW